MVDMLQGHQSLQRVDSLQAGDARLPHRCTELLKMQQQWKRSVIDSLQLPGMSNESSSHAGVSLMGKTYPVATIDSSVWLPLPYFFFVT